MEYALGIDIGGTKIASAIISADGNMVDMVQISSKPESEKSMFDQVILSIEQLMDKSIISMEQLVGIGVGLPGKVDREHGLAVFQNNLPWRNFPIVERLKDFTKISNITIDNDVYMACFSEWKAHDPQEKEVFVYITVSTGIACSIIDQGEFLRGSGFAGELGLFPVQSFAQDSVMERLELLSSGTAIRNRMNNRLDTKQIFDQYHNGEAEYITIIDSAIRSLAHGVYGLCCLLDPHKIVFGGSVINYQPFIIQEVKKHLEKYIISEQKDILNRLYLSKNKGNAGILGAGMKMFE